MDKIYLHEIENNVNLRYTIKDGEPWFISKDVNRILGCVSEDYVDEDDITNITYNNSIGKDENAVGLSLYAISHVISCLMLRNNKDDVKKFKHEIYKKLIPNMRKTTVELSKEDIAILKIFKAKSTMDRANAVAEYKNAVIESSKPAPIVVPKNTYRKDIIKSTPDKVHSLKDVNETLGFKRGQILLWAEKYGYFKYQGSSGKSPNISPEGMRFFNYYNGRNVGVTDEGFSLIEQHTNEIKSAKCKYKKVNILL